MDTDQKGVGILLEAMARIRTEDRLDRPVQLELVGDGERRREYEEQVERLGLQGAVRFHGIQPHQVIASLMEQCHALVLPSLHEAAPLVIIEALASGRPVISTRCGGPEYMLDETTGIVVEPGQPARLASAIVDMLTHLERYDPQTIASTAEERYGQSAITTALDKIYARLCSRQKT
jgi:glycosyltransferase involved in cell wall biosynthesis